MGEGAGKASTEVRRCLREPPEVRRYPRRYVGTYGGTYAATKCITPSVISLVGISVIDVGAPEKYPYLR